MKIAVLVDNANQAISFNETGIVKLYSQNNGKWEVVKEIVFGLDDLLSINEIRERIRKMAAALEDCKVFVATEVTGVPYAILERLGFNIWNIQGVPAGFLDYIAEQEARTKTAMVKAVEKPIPVKTGRDGCYYIDLKTILDKDSTLTSKQVLLPFLRNTDFNELEVICEHAPLWFAKEFPGLKLSATTEQLAADKCKVIVRAEVGCCGECGD
jgi:Fe-only nitrogenase accessory protein AnfO